MYVVPLVLSSPQNVLLICVQSQEAEELSMISVQLVSKFLFNIGFHTKKVLR